MQVQSTGELIKLWREGKVPLLMVAYSWMLGQVGDVLGVQPGEEFRVALVEAQKVGDPMQTPTCCRQARLSVMPLAWTRRRACFSGSANLKHQQINCQKSGSCDVRQLKPEALQARFQRGC